MNTARLLLLFPLFASITYAQSPLITGPNVDAEKLAPSLEQRARTYLYTSRGISNAEDLREKAVKNLTSEGRELYDKQRIEVTGIFATDDGGSDPAGLFDGRIQPAQWGHSSEILPPWVYEVMHKPEDLAGLASDSSGKLSRYAADAISQLQEKDINEIVAHSWGAEIMYNAIFLGKIKPPKRLIICGVTEHNWEKWKALARYTGTEVVVYDNKLDPWAQSARLGDLAQSAGIANGIKLTSDPEALDGLWSLKCAELHGCNPKNRSGGLELKPYFGRPTHDRDAYYKRMLEDGVLHADALEHRQEQEQLIIREENAMFEQALAEAREVIRGSDAEARRFLDAQRKDIDNQRQRQAAPPERLVPSPPPAVPLDSFWLARAYKDLASKACSGTNTLTDADVESSRVYSTGLSVPGAAEIRDTLAGCALYVFDNLVSANQRRQTISARIINDWAAGFRSPSSGAPIIDDEKPPRDRGGKNCGRDKPGDPSWCTP